MASMTCCYAWVHHQAAAWFTSYLLLLFPTCSLSAGRALQLCFQQNSVKTSNIWSSFQKNKIKHVLKASPPGGICPLTAAAPWCLQCGANCTAALHDAENSVSALKLKSWNSISLQNSEPYSSHLHLCKLLLICSLIPPPGSEWRGVGWERLLTKEGSWRALGRWWDAAQGPKVIKGTSRGLSAGGAVTCLLGACSWISRDFPGTGRKRLEFFFPIYLGDEMSENWTLMWAVVELSVISCSSSVGCEGGQEICIWSLVCICC